MTPRSLRRLVLLSLALVAVPVPTQEVQAASVAGSQGTDTSLPLTDSAVTVRGRGDFASVEVTVNQTRNLNNQAVSITWTGATPTVATPGRFGSHYFQIMQCWGDDDGTVPANPGPSPERCVFGAKNSVFGGVGGSSMPNIYAPERLVRASNWPPSVPEVGVLDVELASYWMPFEAVDGTRVTKFYNGQFNPQLSGGQYWLNPYFNIITSNEIVAAATQPNGSGSELFEVQTGRESSGLGCGQRAQTASDGTKRVPRCWLVLVPRGSAEAENQGTPFEGPGSAFYGVVTSPLTPNAWKNRIAIELEFNPVDTPCALGADERRISGNELGQTAIGSWQPALCAGAGLPPFSYASVGDATARQQLASPAPGGPGMVVVSQPFASTAFPPTNPVVYAPLAASGLVIGFNIERNPRFDASADALSLAGIRVAEMNLTPRLVAKLLTQSYRSQLEILSTPDYPWLRGNPANLFADPDFVRFNPEFAQLQTFYGREASGLQLPSGNSDAARAVWEWVLADPEARDWMAGAPDAWGMQVNPRYSTDPQKNPSGTSFSEPVPTQFPKADPYCYQAPQISGIVPAPLCGTDWMPYTRTFAESARVARVAFDGARIVPNPFPSAPSNAWGRDTPQQLGGKTMLALTDTPSATLFGLQVARLSRAGDNGASRTFIAPSAATLRAGIDAMVPSAATPEVLVPDPAVSAPTAYPLTLLSYAALTPLRLDAEAREDYAAFLEYVAGDGQEAGPNIGQLPAGYVPLPPTMQQQTATAAQTVRTLTEPPPPAPEPVPPTTVPLPTAPSAGSGNVFRPAPNRAVQRPTSSGTTPADSVPPVTEPVVDTTPDAPEEDVPQAGEEQPGEVAAGSPSPTPIVKIAGSRMAVPVLGGVAMLAGLAALEISKRPRRKAAGARDEITVEAV